MSDLEPASEGDLAEQRTPVDQTDPAISPVEVPDEATEADVIEQHQSVPYDEDDERR